jgi:hypothetical protein
MASATAKPIALMSSASNSCFRTRLGRAIPAARLRVSATSDVPDFLSSNWSAPFLQSSPPCYLFVKSFILLSSTDCCFLTHSFHFFICFRLEARDKRPFGPRLNVIFYLKIIDTVLYSTTVLLKKTGSISQFTAEEVVQRQLESLKHNDHPHQDYGIEVVYRVITRT